MVVSVPEAPAEKGMSKMEMGVAEQSRYTGFSSVQSMRQDQNAARDSDLWLTFLACLLFFFLVV